MDHFDIVHADADTVTTVNVTLKSDVDLVADHCAALRAAGVTGTKDDRLAMSVPGWVINDWITKRGITFREFMRDRVIQDRFVMDPDNKAFRVWEGRL